MYPKVGVPTLVTYPDRIPIFELFVIWCGSKNGYQKGIMCLLNIGLHPKNMITIF
jgi:hypothetical protein